jgi:2-oxoglutarate dehydrogenase E2 component (dihydrolipoamide succinyltransferase)
MTVELKVPEVGESIQEVQIGHWLKKVGDRVKIDENLVELETDKASVDLPAPTAGVIAKILKKEGATVSVGEVIAYLEDGDGSSAVKSAAVQTPAREAPDKTTKAQPTPPPTTPATDEDEKPRPAARKSAVVVPAAMRALAKYGLCPEQVEATGPGGRLLEEDVTRYVETHAVEVQAEKPAADKETKKEPAPEVTQAPTAKAEPKPTDESKQEPREQAPDVRPPVVVSELEEVVPMSLIRKRIGQRLVEAQQNAALLTTYNEVDMTAVMELRSKYRDAFQAKYGVKLGFMSFFVKATIDALGQFPALNAEIRGTDIVFRNYYHIGVAIGGGKGLVVPVMRNAERMSFAEIEQAIGDFAARAQQNKIKPDELIDGTFTISNGGVYGSLLSMPIVNPPQSGILGMHAIQDRPVARDDQVVIRPMMYVALTYDHRLVDGREAVTFLRRVKEVVEEPSRLLIEV